jgi:hypothetical protein
MFADVSHPTQYRTEKVRLVVIESEILHILIAVYTVLHTFIKSKIEITVKTK